MQRVQHCRVRWPIHQFPDGPQSGSHGAHVSASPPFHPGRRDFPDPVGDVILWPLSSFDLRSALESLCRLDQPRLVHRTVPALTSALSKSVATPAPRVRSVRLTVSSRATAAFTERVAARQPLVVPQHGFVRGEFTALQAFHNVATLSFACPSDRSHGTTRGKDFVVQASIGVVTALHAGPATRLNRSIVAADLSSARSDVLLAAHSFIHNISPVSTGARRPP
jgi:hypothetical protein